MRLWGLHNGWGSQADAPGKIQVEVMLKKRMKMEVGKGGVDRAVRKIVGSSHL